MRGVGQKVWRWLDWGSIWMLYIGFYGGFIWYCLSGSEMYQNGEFGVYPRHLRAGYMFGRKQDRSDLQWSALRRGFFPLFGFTVAYLALSALLRYFSSHAPAKVLYTRRIIFFAVSGLAFTFFLHGWRLVFPLLASLLCYLASTKLRGRKAGPALVWIVSVAFLVSGKYFGGFRPSSFSFFPLLQHAVQYADDHLYKGLYGWDTQFNLTLLRLISYAMDRHWFAQNKKEKDMPNSSSSSGSSEATGGGGGVNTAEMKERSETSPAHRGGGSGQSSNKDEDESGKEAKTRGDTTAKKNELRELMERDPPCIDCFSFLSFLAYILYPPLFIAGPIVTYNAFVNQLFHTGFGQAKTGLMLIVRALFWAFVLEVLLHFVYLYAVSVDRLWLLPGLSPFYVASTGYFTLNFMYIKFLSIWMYFRGFSHVDGVISPNNLIRCVNNNYTFTGFWRQWHASLNKWVLRYLYIPLGGKKSQWWSIWVIFFFIGVWHDLFLVWIAWAMLNCVFFTLEIGVLYAGYAYRNVLARIPMYEVVISWAGALNIFLLMIANLAILYGFGGTKLFLERMFLSDGGWKVFIAAVSSFYAGVRGMRAIRQREERMGLQSDDERRT